MKNKLLLLSVFGAFLISCTASISSKRLKAIEQTSDLKTLLTSQNVNGYTKKTTITPEICEQLQIFHAGQNGSQRATYYNYEETALLMGNYDGTFGPINSGYRNIDGGIQHFKYNGTGNYFENITDYWSYMDQSVGVYYPTLTSLSNLIDQNKWGYSNQTFSFIKSQEHDEKEIALFKNFQFFAAPMILEGAIELQEIDIKLEDDVLSIKLFNTSDLLVSETLVSRGY